MLDKVQFRSLIERVLESIAPELNSEAAVNLLLGTAAQESAFGKYLRQLKGPALGVFQMEPATHQTLWQWLIAHPRFHDMVFGYCCRAGQAEEMEWNLAYAVVMARLNYYRLPFKLPDDPDDIEAMAVIWKRWWNTEAGAGTVGQFISNYARYAR